MMFKKLAQKLAADREKYSSVALNPINADFDERKKTLLNKMSENVVNMYERQADIKKFTKLALSDPENDSHNKIVDALFLRGIVIDKGTNEKLEALADNKKFLKDLGLTD